MPAFSLITRATKGLGVLLGIRSSRNDVIEFKVTSSSTPSAFGISPLSSLLARPIRALRQIYKLVVKMITLPREPLSAAFFGAGLVNPVQDFGTLSIEGIPTNLAGKNLASSTSWPWSGTHRIVSLHSLHVTLRRAESNIKTSLKIAWFPIKFVSAMLALEVLAFSHIANASIANPVNSGEHSLLLHTSVTGVNPDPSLNGNILEGATTSTWSLKPLATAVKCHECGTREGRYSLTSFGDNEMLGIKSLSDNISDETLDISPSDVFTAAAYDWKQIAIAVSISGLEQLQNSGKERQFDLLKARISNAEKTFANNLATDLYSAGTASGGKQIGGLQLLVADLPTSGTVGGISRSSYSWWRNHYKDATTDFGAAVTSANIQSYMNRIWLAIVRGADKPDLILADNNYYRAYWESLQAIQRINSSKMAESGFEALAYMGSDVVFDGGYGGACPTNHMYFLEEESGEIHPIQ